MSTVVDRGFVLVGSGADGMARVAKMHVTLVAALGEGATAIAVSHFVSEVDHDLTQALVAQPQLGVRHFRVLTN